MNTTYDKPRAIRYSARRNAKPISFFIAAPKARTVCLTGDFNDWNPTSHPMQQREGGWWYLQVPLTHGHHLYQFLVDGESMLDPQASGVSRNERDDEASLIAVS